MIIFKNIMYLSQKSLFRGTNIIPISHYIVTKIIYYNSNILFSTIICIVKGVPVDNTALYLLNDKGQTVEPGCVGELYVSGANLASGYVNNRDPHRFVENRLPHGQGNTAMTSTFENYIYLS